MRDFGRKFPQMLETRPPGALLLRFVLRRHVGNVITDEIELLHGKLELRNPQIKIIRITRPFVARIFGRVTK